MSKYLQKQDEKSHDIITIDRFLTVTVLPHMKYDFSNYKFHIYKYHICRVILFQITAIFLITFL